LKRKVTVATARHDFAASSEKTRYNALLNLVKLACRCFLSIENYRFGITSMLSYFE
jgi:hypothetical protein